MRLKMHNLHITIIILGIFISQNTSTADENNSTVDIVKVLADYQQAKQGCSKDKRSLAQVKSQEDLEKFREDAEKKDFKIWIWAGFVYDNKMDVFRYPTDNSVMQENECTLWDEGQPEKSSDASCAAIENNLKVFMRECGTEHYYMCEQEQQNEECNMNQGYYKCEEYCIKMPGVLNNLDNAVENCKQNNGYISAVINDIIFECMLNETYLSKYVYGLYVGLTRENGVWKHGDGTDLTREQAEEIWGKDQPKDGDCAVYSLREEKKLASINCLTPTFFACDIESENSEEEEDNDDDDDDESKKSKEKDDDDDESKKSKEKDDDDDESKKSKEKDDDDDDESKKSKEKDKSNGEDKSEEDNVTESYNKTDTSGRKTS